MKIIEYFMQLWGGRFVIHSRNLLLQTGTDKLDPLYKVGAYQLLKFPFSSKVSDS